VAVNKDCDCMRVWRLADNTAAGTGDFGVGVAVADGEVLSRERVGLDGRDEG